MPTKTLYFLIKIGKKDHIELLRDQGLLYLNTVFYFKEIEEAQRGDANEGLARLEQLTWMKIQLGDRVIELKKGQQMNRLVNAQLRVDNPELQGNIYSMIAVSSDIEANTLAGNAKNKIFGDTFLVITNVAEFFNKIGKQLNDLGYKYKFDFVKYYDPSSHNGKLSVFHKELSFIHQSEFRIFVENVSNEPLSINIGSIADISVMYSIDQFGDISTLPASENHQ